MLKWPPSAIYSMKIIFSLHVIVVKHELSNIAGGFKMIQCFYWGAILKSFEIQYQAVVPAPVKVSIKPVSCSQFVKHQNTGQRGLGLHHFYTST